MAQSNLAYENIKRIEEYHSRKPKKKPIRTQSVRPATLNSSMLVLCVVVMAVTVTLRVSQKAEIAEIHTAIINQEAVVHSLQNENVRMKAELETKSSQKAVEDYAENILGMQKLDKSQIEYINLESGNIVEISEAETDIFAEIKNAVDNLMEYLKG